MAFGTYKEVVCARSTDKDIQKVSQDGGIVTALFAYALEENIIEGAIVAGDTEDPWKPEPTIALSREDLLAAAGTKYTFSPNAIKIKEAVRQNGLEKIGTVGTPCQIMGLRKMQSYPFSTRFVADKIKLMIRIFCTENFPRDSLRTFIDGKLHSSLAATTKMDIGKLYNNNNVVFQ